MLRLERDNKRLEKTMEELRESSAKVVAFEVANRDLNSQCQQKRKELIQLQEASDSISKCSLCERRFFFCV